MTELSYAHGTGTTALLGDTIGRNLDRAVEAYPEREALVDVASGPALEVRRIRGRRRGNWPAD